MSAYGAHFTGGVQISPPLTWSEVKNGKRQGLQDLRMILDERTEDTATGQTRIILATALAPLDLRCYGGYSIAEELQSCIDAYPSHEFEGCIVATPEDPGGEQWRWLVRDRKVVRQVPLAGWRDAETEAGL